MTTFSQWRRELRGLLWPAILCLPLVVMGQTASRAADGFEKVRCDQPIIPAIVGARSGSDRVVRIEARRKAIGLKHLGADMIETGVNTIDWLICGRPFVVLDVRNVTRDAVELDIPSPDTPVFSTETCELRGQKIGGTVLGTFATGSVAGAAMLPIKSAWRIDLQSSKFVPLEPGTTCAADNIYRGGKAG